MDVLIGWPGGDWLGTLKLFGFLVFGYLFILWVASVLWVYKDIRSRSRDPLSQLTGVGIAVVFPIVGLPVYLVLRPSETLSEAYVRSLEQEAILSDLHAISACPNCRRPVEEDFQVCAYCATPLRQPCRRCAKLLQLSWKNCPYCATAVEPARQAARPAAAAPAQATTRPRSEPPVRPQRAEAGAPRPTPAPSRATTSDPFDEPTTTSAASPAGPRQGAGSAEDRG